MRSGGESGLLGCFYQLGVFGFDCYWHRVFFLLRAHAVEDILLIASPFYPPLPIPSFKRIEWPFASVNARLQTLVLYNLNALGGEKKEGKILHKNQASLGRLLLLPGLLGLA